MVRQNLDPTEPLQVEEFGGGARAMPRDEQGNWSVTVGPLALGSAEVRALVGSAPTGYSEDPRLDAKVWESLHISAVFERSGELLLCRKTLTLEHRN